MNKILNELAIYYAAVNEIQKGDKRKFFKSLEIAIQ